MKTNSALLVTLIAFSACHPGKDATKTPASTASDYVAPTSNGECVAPSAWFQNVGGVRVTPPPNEGPTSPFANNQTVTNCDFQQWSWQKFLWLTNQGPSGKPSFLTDLMQVTPTGKKLRNDVVVLSETAQASSSTDILQTPPNAAGKSTTVYYSIFVDKALYDTMSKLAPIAKQNPKQVELETFPVGALELKTSWIEAGVLADSSSYFVTDGVFVDSSGRERAAKVALLGMHVVGVVENHPEFVWSTFEHPQLAPAYDWSKATPTTDAPVTSATDYPLFKAGSTATVKNITTGNGIYTDVFSLYQYGVPVQKQLKGQFDVQVYMETSQDGSQNFNNIRTLNESVQQQLTGVWNNYFENGSLWINTAGYEGTAAQAKLLDGLGSNLSNSEPGKLTRGSVAAYNITMETYVQAGFTPSSIHALAVSDLANCFSCHTAKHSSQLSPLYLSHVFNGYLGGLNGLTRDQVKAAHVQEVREELRLRSKAPSK
ncbi:MAG: hypothetical protein RL685_2624 [Pseudomonadota bacterium]|jgi:hypothetical protein